MTEFDDRAASPAMGKRRAVFFHVPKCGGSTVYQTLAPLFDRALTSHDGSDPNLDGIGVPFISTHRLFHEVATDPEHDLLFTCFRDPIARLQSLYRYWRTMRVPQRRTGDSAEEMKLYRIARAADFSEFLSSPEPELFPHVDNVLVRHFSRVGDCATEENLEEACEVVSRLDAILFAETLHDDLAGLFARLGRAPIFRVETANVTDDLNALNPHAHDPPPPPEAVALTDQVLDLLAPLTRFDLRLVKFAREMAGQKRIDAGNGRSREPVSIEQMRVETLRTGIAHHFGPNKSLRSFLWGEWSAPDDSMTWTLGGVSFLRFKIRRDELGRLNTPMLSLRFGALLPEARKSNRVDLSLGEGDADVAVVFLQTGHALDITDLHLQGDAGRLVVVANSECCVALPMTKQGRLLEDADSRQRDAGEFAYFRLHLRNLPQLPAHLFGVEDERTLGVHLISMHVQSADAPVSI